jgi:AAA ATPase-like protein
MLKSFSAKNFRGLKDFEVHNLTRINLIVGDNDVGKTALTEALFAHLAQGNILALVQLKGFRRSPFVADESCWDDFFHNFDTSLNIELASIDAKGVDRTSRISVGRKTQMNVAVPSASGTNVEGQQQRILSAAAMYRPLRVEFKTSSAKEPFSNELTFDPQRRTFTQIAEFTPEPNSFYFSTAGPPELEGLVRNLSNILVGKKQSDVIALGKTIEANIQGLSVASPKGLPEVFVDTGEATLMPLTLFGSGVVRAIGIGSAIPAHQGGVVLVDEIETGIYFSRLGEFWRTIFEMAKKDDVQIVATSHSDECVRAAIDAVTPDIADSDPLHVYKIVSHRNRPIPYERDSLKSASAMMADLR